MVLMVTKKMILLCLPQMSGYIKYFQNGGKNMFFMIEDNDICWQNITKFETKFKKH